MKKKILSTRLSLNKKIIASLTDDALPLVVGGVGNTYAKGCLSIVRGCPTTNPTFQPNCTFGICVIQQSDDCPTYPCITEPPTFQCGDPA